MLNQPRPRTVSGTTARRVSRVLEALPPRSGAPESHAAGLHVAPVWGQRGRLPVCLRTQEVGTVLCPRRGVQRHMQQLALTCRLEGIF